MLVNYPPTIYLPQSLGKLQTTSYRTQAQFFEGSKKDTSKEEVLHKPYQVSTKNTQSPNNLIPSITNQHTNEEIKEKRSQVERTRDVVKGCRPNNDVAIDRGAPRPPALTPAAPSTPARCTPQSPYTCNTK